MSPRSWHAPITALAMSFGFTLLFGMVSSPVAAQPIVPPVSVPVTQPPGVPAPGVQPSGAALVPPQNSETAPLETTRTEFQVSVNLVPNNKGTPTAEIFV